MSKVVQVQKFYFPEEIWQFVKEYMGVDGGIPVLLSKRLWQLPKDDLYTIINKKMFICMGAYGVSGHKKKYLVSRIIEELIYNTYRTKEEKRKRMDSILNDATIWVKMNEANRRDRKIERLMNK
jgi:hypothetical protein